MRHRPTETPLSRKELYRGRILDVYVDTVRLPNGREGIREVIGHMPAVAVVPVLENSKIVLVRQYRYAVNAWMWEIPAGLRTSKEPPQRAAKRELREETGFTAKTLKPLGRFFSSPGFCQESIHLYLAQQLIRRGALKLDEDEFLTPSIFSRTELSRMLRRGDIVDAKTVLALQLAAKEMRWSLF